MDIDPAFLPPAGSIVVLGVSGGVDSAVAAAILKNHGCMVHAIFLKLFDSPFMKASEHDAFEAMEHIGIPFQSIDVCQKFHDSVVTPFIQTYEQGRTPVPCVLCNPLIKFASLTEAADQIGANFIATGHYVRKYMLSDSNKKSYIPALSSALTQKQDQSFFLYRLTHKQLQRAFFPLGQMTSKDQTRSYAQKLGLKIAHKKSAFDICFLADCQGDYKKFMRQNAAFVSPSLQPGPISNKQGQVLGHHNGSFQYTIGQRHGLNISAKDPLYVLQIHNQNVIVGPKEELAVYGVHLTSCVFQTASSLFLKQNEPTHLYVQYRSTTAAVPAVFFQDTITFDQEQFGIASGQSAVLRSQEGIVLGGGIISDTF